MLPHVEDLGFRVQRCGGFRDITSYIGFRDISPQKERHRERAVWAAYHKTDTLKPIPINRSGFGA